MGDRALNKDAPADVDDDFADLRDIDFSQYIADKDDNAGSMNSPSSPSVGMMSKTPFKTPAPSEYADDPIEMDSSPAGRPIRLRDYLPGLGSSIEPSFAMDDSQQTKVIPKGALINKAVPNPLPRVSYSLSISPDNAVDAPSNTKAGQLDIEPGSPIAEVAAPAKRKKTAQGQKAEPKKRVTRNRKVNGKKKVEPKHDDIPAAEPLEEAAPPEEVEPAETRAKEVSPAKEATPAEATPSKRPLLARMLSLLSEPGSLKWEEPLVGGRQSPVDSDGRSSVHWPSSLGGTPAVQEDITAQPVDDDGSIYEPSIPASFAEPFELSGPPELERVHAPTPAVPGENKASPISRLDLNIIDTSPQKGSPFKSPVKVARKKPSPEKRGRANQKAPAPAKRRRVQEPVKKRVVQPRAKAKNARTHEDIDDALVIPVNGTHESETTAIPEPSHVNSKTLVSEAGSPDKITLPSESASPGEDRTNKTANSPGLSGNTGAVDPPNYDASRTRAPDVEAVFQSQPSRPRVRTAQVDSPQLRGTRVAGTVPKKNPSALITPKSTSKPSGAGTKKSAEKNALTDARSQKPGFEVFRQHILGQLTTMEARQQSNQPSESGSPEGPGGTSDGRARAPMSIVPQHMLGRVLHTITEVG